MDEDIGDELDQISVSESAICEVEQTKLMPHFLVPTMPMEVDREIKQLKNTQSVGYDGVCTKVININENFDGFTVLLKRHDIDCDISILTESWLVSDPLLPNLNGYSSYATTKHALQNDEIVVYPKSDINITFEEPTFLEGNCLVMKLGHETAIIAIYH
ncbi:unnamed protein product [Parnassius apollo]|uniref:(apollo) hypothetical protein n=1 Tax=Parnassius apollo TaxID=110799 RepID=A0A8S3X752_PARAO|nr:unnamed protein product [Parnassius apollo]